MQTRYEAELLLHCVRAEIAEDRLRFLLHREIDWPVLTRLAREHGVLPTVYRALETHCKELVPGPAMEELQDQFHRNALRNQILAGELVGLLDLLEGQGIRTVSFKGPTLAVVAFGSLSLRQFTDLDILVQEKDRAATLSLLQERGFRSYYRGAGHPLSGLSPAQLGSYLRRYHEYELVRDDGVQVDLHWQLAPACFPFRPQPASFWSGLCGISMMGREVPGLADELLLYFLTMHGAKERWRKLGWIVDVDRLVRSHPELDWGEVWDQAERARGTRVLGFGLGLSAALLGTSLPGNVQRWMVTYRVNPRLAQRVSSALLADPSPGRDFAHCTPISGVHFSLCLGFADKARYLSRRLFTPDGAEYARVRLPDSLFFAYRLLRPLRILARCIRNALRRGFGLTARGKQAILKGSH